MVPVVAFGEAVVGEDSVVVLRQLLLVVEGVLVCVVQTRRRFRPHGYSLRQQIAKIHLGHCASVQLCS